MPAKRGTKRVAEVSVEQEAAKRLQGALRKHGVTKSTYSGIVEAINHPFAEGLTEEVRKMLVAMLPEGVCVAMDEREEAQELCIRMLGEVYKSIMAKMREQIDETTSALAAVELSKSALEAKVAEAAASLKAATDAATERKATLAEHTRAAIDAKSVLEEKEKDQTDCDDAHEKAKEEKAALEAALAEDFRLLREGEVELEEAKVRYQKIASLTSTLGLEDSLMTALPTVMVKKPSERGSFDAMVVAQLEEGLVARVAKLAETIEAGAPAAAVRAEATAVAKRALESAKEVQQASAEELSSAQQEQSQREAEHKTSLQEAAKFEPEHNGAVQTLDEKKSELEGFKGFNLACFETLRDRESKKPKPAAPATDIDAARHEMEVAAAMEAAEAGA